MKEIEKYIGYYFLVYFSVLALCGFFQYLAVCQGKSLECSFSMTGINTIITTTAYVLTPIIAIIGFQSWRNQETYRKSQELITLIIDKTREFNNAWNLSREYEDFSRFQDYCMKDIVGFESLDNLEKSKEELSKIVSVFNVFHDLDFLVDKLYINSNLDMTKINEIINNVNIELKQTLEDLTTFQQNLIHIRYAHQNVIKPEHEIRKICDKLDRYCNTIMGSEFNIERDDYSLVINEHIKKIIKEVIELKRKI